LVPALAGVGERAQALVPESGADAIAGQDLAAQRAKKSQRLRKQPDALSLRRFYVLTTLIQQAELSKWKWLIRGRIWFDKELCLSRQEQAKTFISPYRKCFSARSQVESY
jgi:hypothetical protein